MGGPRQPIDDALDVALLVMRNGGSTTLADRAFQSVLRGYKETGVGAAWRLDFVAAVGRDASGSTTVLRQVGPIGVNLARVFEAVRMADRIASGDVATTAIPSEVERVATLQPPYPRWAMVALAACTAACFSRVCGGDWGAFAVAGAAAGAGQVLRPVLQARKLAVAGVTLVCGALSSGVAAVGLHLGWSATAPAALVASVIYMVPGLPLINGFMDLISHRHLIVGLERIANATFLFVILAIAIAFADVLVHLGSG